MSENKTYKIWRSMLARCANPRIKEYRYYGARGIAVCERWQMLENFLADMGECPPKHSIERINNEGPYSPDNCKWAQRTEQNNNRRNNIILTHAEKTMTIAQWARYLGIPRTTIVGRWKKEYPIEKILSKEVFPSGCFGKEPASARIKRAMTHCKRGHELFGDNLYQPKPNKRVCRTCMRAAQRRFLAKWRNHLLPPEP